MRGQFELPADLVYLNNGSFGPSPKVVLDAAAAYLRQVDANPGEMLSVYRGKVKETKARLGAYVGMAEDDFVFITNVTVGMNMVSRGLRNLGEGDELLTTNLEYGAVDNAWEFAARHKGFEIRRVEIPSPPEDAEQIVSLIRSGFTDRTRVLSFSHISTKTGLIFPVTRICAAARERGIVTVIDGAHAPGMIPFDVSSLGCDFYTGNCHKWLCAPKGTAFLWARPEAQLLLDPFIVGWGWNRDGETYLGNFENPGTHCLALPAAVAEAIGYQESIGREAIAARGRELAAYGRAVIGAIPGTRILTPDDPALANSLTAFALPLMSQERLAAELASRRIIIPNGPREDHTWLRLSSHVYNMPWEIDLLAEAVTTALAAG